jgi:hypothetical protein
VDELTRSGEDDNSPARALPRSVTQRQTESEEKERHHVQRARRWSGTLPARGRHRRGRRLIRGKSIGFRGLRNEAEVIVAASVGWRTLQSLLHREYAGRPREEVNWERLRFVNDGAYEWVSDGRIPLARVFRASHAAALGSDDAVTTYPPRRQLARRIQP